MQQKASFYLIIVSKSNRFICNVKFTKHPPHALNKQIWAKTAFDGILTVL